MINKKPFSPNSTFNPKETEIKHKDFENYFNKQLEKQLNTSPQAPSRYKFLNIQSPTSTFTPNKQHNQNKSQNQSQNQSPNQQQDLKREIQILKDKLYLQQLEYQEKIEVAYQVNEYLKHQNNEKQKYSVDIYNIRILQQIKGSNSATNQNNNKQANYFIHQQQALGQFENKIPGKSDFNLNSQKLADLLLENNLFYKDSFKLIEMLQVLSTNKQSINQFELSKIQQSNIQKVGQIIKQIIVEYFDNEKSFQQKIEKQKNEIDLLIQEINDFSSQLEEIQNSKKKSNLEEIKEGEVNPIDNINIDETQKERNVQNEQLQEQIRQIEQLKQQLSEMEVLKKQNIEIDELRNQVSQIEQMKVEVNNLEKQNLEYKKQIQEIDHLKKQLGDVQNQKNEMEKNLKNQIQQLQMNSQKMEQEVVQVEKMRRLSQQSQLEIDNLKLQKQQLELQHESIKDDYQKLWAQNQVLLQQSNERHVKLCNIENEKEQLTVKLSSLEQELNEKSLIIQQKIEEISISKEDIDKQKQEIAEYQRVLEIWQKNDFDLRKELDELKENAYSTEFVNAQNQQLEELLQNYKREVDNLSSQKYEQKNEFKKEIEELKQKLIEIQLTLSQKDELIITLQQQLVNQQVHLQEEQVLTKEDVASSSSDNSQIAEYEEQIKMMESELNELKKENQDLKSKLRQTSKMNKSQTMISTKPSPSTFYWDLEIIACQNSLLSLVNDKWIMNFRNTDQQITEYIEQISLFSFEQNSLNTFISQFFNNSESITSNLRKSFLILGYFEQDTTYLKIINRKMNLNLSPKKSFGKITIPKPYLLLSKLLKGYEEHTSFEVSENFLNETALNEFWLKYGLTQKGIVIFTCSKLNLQGMQFIRYLNSLISLSNEVVLFVFITQFEEGGQFEQELQLMDFQLPSNDDLQSHRKFMINFSQKDIDKRKIVEDIIMNNQKQNKRTSSLIESLREFMVDNVAHFYEIKENEISPDFDMQQVDKEDRWYFRLLINRNSNNNYTLKTERQTQFFLLDKMLTNVQEREEDIIVTIEMETQQIIDIQINFSKLPGVGTKIIITINTSNQKLRTFLQYLPIVKEEYTKTIKNNVCSVNLKKMSSDFQ